MAQRSLAPVMFFLSVPTFILLLTTSVTIKKLIDCAKSLFAPLPLNARNGQRPDFNDVNTVRSNGQTVQLSTACMPESGRLPHCRIRMHSWQRLAGQARCPVLVMWVPR
jgi:hypothetical protein